MKPVPSQQILLKFLLDLQMLNPRLPDHLCHIRMTLTVQDKVTDKPKEISILRAVSPRLHDHRRPMLKKRSGRNSMKTVPVPHNLIFRVRPVKKENIRSLKPNLKLCIIPQNNLPDLPVCLPPNLLPKTVMCIKRRHTSSLPYSSISNNSILTIKLYPKNVNHK